MRQLIKLFTILLAVLLLAGCGGALDLGASPDKNFVKKSPKERAKELSDIVKYRVVGAFGVTPKDGKQKIINYNWYYQGDNFFRLRLTTPGGFYSTTLSNFHGSYTFWHGPTRFVRTKSFRNLMLAEIGWYIPLDKFYYWLRGLPAPQAKSKSKIITKYDKYGHLVTLGQDGWVLSFSRYIKKGADDMPTKIKVWGHHVKLDIAIKEWIFYFDQELMDVSKTNKVLLESIQVNN